MTGRDYDFEELRPLGEASRTPDHRLADHASVDARRQRRASGETGYPSHATNDEAACRSCGAPIPASQTKCRLCLTNHLGDTAAETTDTAQESTLVGVVFVLVESATFYGAVAKGAAAGNLLVASETPERIDDHRLIYDLESEPAPQLVDRWPSLPEATTVPSTTGEQLLTAIRERTDWQAASSPTRVHEASEQDGRTYLYNERGDAVLTESRRDTLLERTGDPMWLVPGIALRDSIEAGNSDDQARGSPTTEQLECHHCGGDTDHRFRGHESLPDETWSGQPIWECQECDACRYGPDRS